MRRSSRPFRLTLCNSISFLALPFLAAAPMPAFAQSTADEVIVTATRRDASIQSVPLNIGVVSGENIQAQGLTDLAEAAAWIPGVHLIDTGSRSSERIVIRGLNADPVGATDTLGNSAGDVVSTYVGDVPMYVDLRLEDMSRVEFLLGPQGTLYGKGTMGGAIRYIPNRPVFGEESIQIRGEASQYKGVNDISGDLGATVNAPLTDNLAMRATLSHRKDSGFIDYDFAVPLDKVGLVNPNIIDPTAPGYGLVPVKNANYEDVWSGRLGLRWAPTSRLDANLTYYYQDEIVGARQMSSARGVIPNVGDYVSTLRVTEPNYRKNELLALEMTADLGFADLTSSTGMSRYKERGQRDQTNLLISLEFSYELFPEFTAFTNEISRDKTFTQEFRLVSKTPGPLQWIAGAFYSDFGSKGYSREFTPHYDAFLGTSRPDSLEYISYGIENLAEKAAFGELSYDFTDRWQATLGARYFAYNLKTQGAFDTPLFNTLLGAPPDEIVLNLETQRQKDSGWLFKFNTSYKFTDDALAYLTVSQGNRPGGGNGIAPCPDPLPAGQQLCALPKEVQFGPDTTTNYEIGVHTQWLDRRLTLNGSVYYIDWSDVQLASTTINGGLPFTTNGAGARTQGVELNFSADVTSAFNVRGSFSYADAELTEDVVGLVPYIQDPALPLAPGTTPFETFYEDGKAGDRLPGSPREQASLFATYTAPLSDTTGLDFSWGATYVGDVLTRTGGRGAGTKLDSYTLNNASIGLKTESWTVTLFANNVFDEFAETAVQATPRSNQNVADINGDTVYYRGHWTTVLPPRVIGVRFVKNLDF